MAKAQAALVIDIFVRKIFRWRLSNSMIANFTPDAFKHVVCRRHPAQDGVILPQYFSEHLMDRRRRSSVGPGFRPTLAEGWSA